MRNHLLICTILASTVLYSCNQNHGSDKSLEKAISTTCYMAVDGKDTARMELGTFNKEKIKGNLVVSYDKKDNNHGEFEGSFKGDTLTVIYTFQIGKNPTVYKNPLAFLKKDGKLIMGIGKIENVLGRTFFSKGVPIDFAQGRFTYAPIACKKELK
ncbi:hypothetical protein TH53_10750 [Pedobacter lusitanus]|uniref:Contig44, whole genome shotgun sequence n=1 Tax=Pedobacter lusitanus TaxID=1503925 RepID=A0A0D0GLQ0_9SPHI|nr:hypothetical protein [Pedobacter lusitanus]KIO77120.1 hypothetical protein TH53_10750 [Pedobacter lusitanus]